MLVVTHSSSWLRLSVYNHDRDNILPLDILLSRIAIIRHHRPVFYHTPEVRGWRIRVSGELVSSSVCSWLVKDGVVPVCVCTYALLSPYQDISQGRLGPSLNISF